jgi:uncharacterized protein YkwD
MKTKISPAKIVYLALFLLLLTDSQASAIDSDMARQVLAEINLARTEPKTYAGFLRQFRGYFKGKLYQLPGSETRIQTVEGRSAVDEAIRFLSRQKAVHALLWSQGLAAAATGLAVEQGRSGETGHQDRQGNGPRERIEKQGRWERSMAENIGYGPTEARDMVLQLIVDDGVPGRGHRKNIFSSSFTTAGVACGPHPGFGSVCVIDFAGGFKE